MKNVLSPWFFILYVRNTAKKDWFKKGVTTLVCAGAVAFCALCGGYLNSYAAVQQEQIKSISERQLVVFNRTFSENYLTGQNAGIDLEAFEQFSEIKGIESIAPVLYFVSDWHMTAGVSKYSYEELVSTEEAANALDLHFSYRNRNGDSETVESTNHEGRMGATSLYAVESYAVENYYDPRCDVLDLTVKDGAYITKQFADALGITDDMVNGLMLEFDIWVPTAELEYPTEIVETTLVNGQEVEEGYWARLHGNYYDKTRIVVPLRGIFDMGKLSGAYSTAEIFMPASAMMGIVKQNIDTEHEDALAVSKINQSFRDISGATVDTKEIVRDWKPSAYYIVTEDLTSVTPVKEELSKISQNFDFVQEYQDIAAGIQYVNNSRNVLFYVSYAVLFIALLLMALIYVSLIDRRKFEFAVLRANGMTKREIRKIIYAEMIFQFLAIFIIGMLLSLLIYFIGGQWLGYPFQFDGMTVLWLLVISLGSIVLPTIVSLLFVNKFEPDEIMRN